MPSVSDLSHSPRVDDLFDATAQSSGTAADEMSAVGSAVTGKKPGSLGQKLALASVAIRLFRRYPVATLCLAGLAVVVVYASRRGAFERAIRH
jgi:hypothetical protein